MVEMVLTQDEQNRITEAIRAAERRTSGEIIVAVARQASPYTIAALIAAGTAALASLSLFPLLFPWHGPGVTATLVVATFLSVLILLETTGLILWFVPDIWRQKALRALAIRHFCANGLDRTKERNGIMIAVSFREQRIEIVVDRGIDEKVPDQTWTDLAARLSDDLRTRPAGDALVESAKACGDLLALHFPNGADDINEISDQIVKL